MTGKYGNLDYPKLTKRGMVVGFSLFLIGEAGNYAASEGLVQMPLWEASLLLDVAFLGILLILLSPFVFGIVLPLTE